jgi:hypothetical protein
VGIFAEREGGYILSGPLHGAKFTSGPILETRIASLTSPTAMEEICPLEATKKCVGNAVT